MNRDSSPTTGRRIAGVLHSLVGLGVLLLAFSGIAGAASQPHKLTAANALGMLFAFGIGGALLWIGIGDVRGIQRPSWIVRLALYLPILACLPMTIQVMREAAAKQRAINNLRQLGEAIQQYEADFKIAPKPLIEPETASPEDDLPLP